MLTLKSVSSRREAIVLQESKIYEVCMVILTTCITSGTIKTCRVSAVALLAIS